MKISKLFSLVIITSILLCGGSASTFGQTEGDFDVLVGGNSTYYEHDMEVLMSFIDGYASYDNSVYPGVINRISMLGSSLFQYAQDNGYEIVLYSYGNANYYSTIADNYPDIFIFMPSGSNSFSSVFHQDIETSPMGITAAGEDTNVTGYATEFHSIDPRTSDNLSSFANGYIAGQLTYIAVTLGISIDEARMIARETGSRNGEFDIYSGYGLIDVESAITIPTIVPVVNGRVIATVDVPNLTYTARIQIQVSGASEILKSANVKYGYSSSGMTFMDGEILTFNGAGNYTAGVVADGTQHVIIETTLNSGTGIQVTSSWVDLAILNFDIINVTETSGLCPIVTTFNSGPQWINGIWNCDNTPLPVELTAFTAKYVNNDIVLNWETATEINNYGFEIERDGQMINFIKGHGNSNSPKHYTYVDENIATSGTYTYRLKQIDNDGTYEYSDEIAISVDLPSAFKLSQCYPNPFNPTTTIEYTTPHDGNVKLEVYSILGNIVSTLVDNYEAMGNHSVEFNATNLPSGIYFYRIMHSGYTLTKQMVLLK
ncbi:hypothetical protein LCGC14_1232840 [marine sediment metagenome]|uniref:Secretion system C-terminal sorting domain-containing protein n=1 Tax=marine sediment metagenome TaxID=412755 RepID=A0A0F9L827_9ZZZZ